MLFQKKFLYTRFIRKYNSNFYIYEILRLYSSNSNFIVPEKRHNVDSVNTFLLKIGRNCLSVAGSKFKSWDDFFTQTSAQMKINGIDVKTRKYILLWREKYRSQGEELYELPTMKKVGGGERKKPKNKK